MLSNQQEQQQLQQLQRQACWNGLPAPCVQQPRVVVVNGPTEAQRRGYEQLLIHSPIPYVIGSDFGLLRRVVQSKQFDPRQFEVVCGLEDAVNRMKLLARPGICMALFYQLGIPGRPVMHINVPPADHQDEQLPPAIPQQDLMNLAKYSILWIFLYLEPTRLRTQSLYPSSSCGGVPTCRTACIVRGEIQMPKDVYCALSPSCKHTISVLISIVNQYLGMPSAGAIPSSPLYCRRRTLCSPVAPAPRFRFRSSRCFQRLFPRRRVCCFSAIASHMSDAEDDDQYPEMIGQQQTQQQQQQNRPPIFVLLRDDAVIQIEKVYGMPPEGWEGVQTDTGRNWNDWKSIVAAMSPESASGLQQDAEASEGMFLASSVFRYAEPDDELDSSSNKQGEEYKLPSEWILLASSPDGKEVLLRGTPKEFVLNNQVVTAFQGPVEIVARTPDIEIQLPSPEEYKRMRQRLAQQQQQGSPSVQQQSKIGDELYNRQQQRDAEVILDGGKLVKETPCRYKSTDISSNIGNPLKDWTCFRYKFAVDEEGKLPEKKREATKSIQHNLYKFQDSVYVPSGADKRLAKAAITSTLQESREKHRFSVDPETRIVYRLQDPYMDPLWYRAQLELYADKTQLISIGIPVFDLIFAAVEVVYASVEAAVKIGKAAAPFILDDIKDTEDSGGGFLSGLRRSIRQGKSKRLREKWRKEAMKEIKKHPDWTRKQKEEYVGKLIQEKTRERVSEFPPGAEGQLQALRQIQRLSIEELKILGKPVVLDLWMIGALVPFQERMLWFDGFITEKDIKNYAPYIQGTAPKSLSEEYAQLLRPKPLVDEESGEIRNWDESVSIEDVVPKEVLDSGKNKSTSSIWIQTALSDTSATATETPYEEDEDDVASRRLYKTHATHRLDDESLEILLQQHTQNISLVISSTVAAIVGAAIIAAVGTIAAAGITAVGATAAAATPHVLAGWARGAGGWGDKVRRTKKGLFERIKRNRIVQYEGKTIDEADEQIAKELLEKSKNVEPAEAVRIIQEMTTQQLQSLPKGVILALVTRNILAQDQVGFLIATGLVSEKDTLGTIYDLAYIAHLQNLSKRQLVALPLETLRLFLRAGVLTMPQVRFLLDRQKIQKGDIQGTMYKKELIEKAGQLEDLPDNNYDPTVAKLALFISKERISEQQLLKLSDKQIQFFLRGTVFSLPQVKLLKQKNKLPKRGLKFTSYIERAVDNAQDYVPHGEGAKLTDDSEKKRKFPVSKEESTEIDRLLQYLQGEIVPSAQPEKKDTSNSKSHIASSIQTRPQSFIERRVDEDEDNTDLESVKDSKLMKELETRCKTYQQDLVREISELQQQYTQLSASQSNGATTTSAIDTSTAGSISYSELSSLLEKAKEHEKKAKRGRAILTVFALGIGVPNLIIKNKLRKRTEECVKQVGRLEAQRDGLKADIARIVNRNNNGANASSSSSISAELYGNQDSIEVSVQFIAQRNDTDEEDEEEEPDKKKKKFKGLTYGKLLKQCEKYEPLLKKEVETLQELVNSGVTGSKLSASIPPSEVSQEEYEELLEKYRSIKFLGQASKALIPIVGIFIVTAVPFQKMALDKCINNLQRLAKQRSVLKEELSQRAK